MTREYEIREELRKVPHIRADVLEGWTQLNARSFEDPVIVGKQKAADLVAKTFAGHVYEKNKFKLFDEPEGKLIRCDMYAMTYEELFELAVTLYGLGQKDGMKRNIQVGV